MELLDRIDALKGVGPKKKQIFEEHGIHTLEDLLYFMPRSFEDRREVTKISQLREGEDALAEARVLSSRSRPAERRGRYLLMLRVSDDTGILDVFFFNCFYSSKVFRKGGKYVFYGKVSKGPEGRFRMTNPEYCEAGGVGDIRGILPVYPALGKLSQNEIRKYQINMKPLYGGIKEWLPEEILKEYNLAGIRYAVSNSHFPGSGKKYRAAKYRLIFDEFLTMEAGLFYMREDKGGKTAGAIINTVCVEEFIKELPFRLTKGQRKTWESVAEDLSSPKAMNRLKIGRAHV